MTASNNLLQKCNWEFENKRTASEIERRKTHLLASRAHGFTVVVHLLKLCLVQEQKEVKAFAKDHTSPI